MITVFLDESGDLGFDLSRRATSDHFLVTALVCPDVKAVDKAVKKVFSEFSKTEVRNHHGYLHAFAEKPQTRRRLLGLLARLDVGVEVIVLDKRRVFTNLGDEPHVLYASIVNVLMSRLLARQVMGSGEPVRLVASQRETVGFLNRSFVAFLNERMVTPPGVTVTVEVVHTSAEKGLQAVDLVSWSLFRQIEHGDPTYADMIRPRIWGVGDVFG
jgi:hypothetical protein